MLPVGLHWQNFHHFPQILGPAGIAHAGKGCPALLSIHGLEQKPVACQLLGPGLFCLKGVEALHVADNLEVGCLEKDYSQKQQKDQLPEKRVRKPQKTPA